MSAMRDELHQLVDRLPEEQLAPVLQLIRRDERRAQAVATLKTVQQRMAGVTGVDEDVEKRCALAVAADVYVIDTGVFVSPGASSAQVIPRVSKMLVGL
jgi:Mlc titration factor MtfA (ptsG expression regulator)